MSQEWSNGSKAGIQASHVASTQPSWALVTITTFSESCLAVNNTLTTASESSHILSAVGALGDLLQGLRSRSFIAVVGANVSSQSNNIMVCDGQQSTPH
eukprot:CAMPEP_0194537494 /NCGR_PEP_ID=MMETSP0253-20130528/76777_1 /TAXON_ID=2966 /ORGANISM="Noctiluca scintillans" /LENGTH=98 /DNA_ID=CAMNT_0039383521 /DNA_START=643 /DNA_END=939 /DNA_ORIENTATION=-